MKGLTIVEIDNLLRYQKNLTVVGNNQMRIIIFSCTSFLQQSIDACIMHFNLKQETKCRRHEIRPQ